MYKVVKGIVCYSTFYGDTVTFKPPLDLINQSERIKVLNLESTTFSNVRNTIEDL